MKDQTLEQGGDGSVQSLDPERMRPAFCAAVEAACTRGWKKEAIAAAIGVDPSYFTKLRTGEKPLSRQHIERLPDDIEAIFARHYAESFDLVVVEPLDDETATHHLASGLFNLLRARLPARATRLAKARIGRRQMLKAALR